MSQPSVITFVPLGARIHCDCGGVMEVTGMLRPASPCWEWEHACNRCKKTAWYGEAHEGARPPASVGYFSQGK